MLVFDQLRKGDRRLRLLAIAVACGLVVLVVGLWYLQVASARRYQASLENQTYRTVRVPATRGKIYDRNGQCLAENRPSYILYLYLEELRPAFERTFTQLRAGRRLGRTARERMGLEARSLVASNTVQRIAEFLGQPVSVTDHDFRRHHRQWPYRPMTIRENLTPLQIARLLEQAPAIPGLDLDVQPVRFYPSSNTVSHLLGHLRRDDQARDEEEGGFSYSLPSYDGELGVEYLANDALRGRPGVKSVIVNSLSYRESETVWTAARAGENLTLTLDLPLQHAATAALRSAGAGTRGAVVVLDTANGDVLALVSCPSYDPNEFISPLPPERWAVLNDPQQRPMFNRATQGAYNPGSIFKIVTGLAALEAGIDPAETYRVEPDPARPGYGAIFVRRRKIEDTAPPGEYDFKEAFKHSSNAYFIQLGLRAGRERVLAMGRRFHLGERLDLGTRQEVAGEFPNPGDVVGVWNDGNLANVCIGQEITVTPLQMAVLTAAVANGGRIFYPRIVLRSESPDPQVDTEAVRTFQPRLRSEIHVEPRHLARIRTAMLADTEEPGGTGFAAFQTRSGPGGQIVPRLPGFRVGGKTGTAQVRKPGGAMDHITWFVAFGPFEDPHYAVVVMVESGSSGGGTCAPIARQVFQFIQERQAAGRGPRLAQGR
jgi:penicillin-binding protein 2